MKTILIICFSILLLPSYSWSQDKEEEMLEEAIGIFGFNEKDKAFEALQKVLNKFPNYPRTYFVKANWHIQYEEHDLAIQALEKLQALNPKFNPLQKKMMAVSYFAIKKYSEAEKWIREFQDEGTLNPENRDFANAMLRNIEFAKSFPPENFNIQFEPLGAQINTDENEYFPSTNADESALYFTRKSRGTEDIWVSQKTPEGWRNAIPIDEPEIEGNNKVVSINSYENDGAHTIAPTGRFLFFTSCGRFGNIGSCDIYFSKKSGNSWGKPNILPPPINSPAWETQPCISADGKWLFYVSSREGGYGKGDIYVTKIQDDGKFSAPENLGSTINTSGSEDKPFIHPDGNTLYFSSDGHPGFGQRDLFMSRRVHGKWSTPINLGPQINSSGDESAIFVNALGQRAYVSKQNLTKPKKDIDIYTFDLPELFKPKKVTYIKGIITNARTGQPLKTSVKIHDMVRNEPVMSITSDEKTGDFLLTLISENDYGFHVLKEGFSLYSRNYSFESTSDNKPITMEIKLDPLEAGTKFELRNVFFETGQYALKSESYNELNYILEILNKNPGIKILISGHTDNVGSEESNQKLSENRARSVLEYLTSKGISSDRLTSKGFGSSKPLSTNDTDEGRARNRRTEIEIL